LINGISNPHNKTIDQIWDEDAIKFTIEKWSYPAIAKRKAMRSYGRDQGIHASEGYSWAV
jgi:hypothetical protein